MPSSDIGSVRSDRPGLRTYCGEKHSSECMFGIYTKFGVNVVFRGPFGLPCAKLRFGFGLSAQSPMDLAEDSPESPTRTVTRYTEVKEVKVIPCRPQILRRFRI